MRSIKLFLSLLLALILATGAVSSLAEGDAEALLGQPLADFSVTTITGDVFTLSEALQEKGCVLINLWASWCGPCEMEFPYLEEAWEQYQDRVAVIALSVEPEDSDEVLTEYAEGHGLTFPIANEGELTLGDDFAYEGIPTTLIVDRFGCVAFREVGSQSSAGAFTRVFDYFLSEDYTETAVLDEVPPQMPTVENPDDAELGAALNVEGGEIAFHNSEDPTVWPMLPADKDGRAVLVNSNANEPGSTAAVYASVTAEAGDALAFDIACSTNPVLNALTIAVDGETVSVISGMHEFATRVLPLEAGEHEISFTYDPYDPAEENEDTVWLDDVRLLSGDEAAAALAEMPVYPYGDEFAVTLMNEDVKEIVFSGDAEQLAEYFGTQSAYIVPGGEATVKATLTADILPEKAFFYCYYDGSLTPLSDCAVEDGYVTTGGIDSMADTGYSYGAIYAYNSIDYQSNEDMRGVLLFVDEENVNTFVAEEAEYDGLELTWAYADGAAPATDEAATGESAVRTWEVSFVDQNGDPVPGCIINFCTDESCVPTVAGEDGVAVFTGAPYAYHLQVIKVPEGYEFDTTQEFYAEEAGGALSFTVNKK